MFRYVCLCISLYCTAAKQKKELNKGGKDALENVNFTIFGQRTTTTTAKPACMEKTGDTEKHHQTLPHVKYWVHLPTVLYSILMHNHTPGEKNSFLRSFLIFHIFFVFVGCKNILTPTHYPMSTIYYTFNMYNHRLNVFRKSSTLFIFQCLQAHTHTHTPSNRTFFGVVLFGEPEKDDE